jgi:hypothetical protein
MTACRDTVMEAAGLVQSGSYPAGVTMRTRQSGQGRIGCILWLAAFAIAGLVAYKMIPVRIQSAELYDFMVEQAKWAGNRPPDAIKKAIVQRAKELELPLEQDAVTVQRNGDRIRMEAEFTVPVEFPGYTYYWDFHHQVDRTIFVF